VRRAMPELVCGPGSRTLHITLARGMRRNCFTLKPWFGVCRGETALCSRAHLKYNEGGDPVRPRHSEQRRVSLVNRRSASRSHLISRRLWPRRDCCQRTSWPICANLRPCFSGCEGIWSAQRKGKDSRILIVPPSAARAGARQAVAACGERQATEILGSNGAEEPRRSPRLESACRVCYQTTRAQTSDEFKSPPKKATSDSVQIHPSDQQTRETIAANVRITKRKVSDAIQKLA